MNEPEKETMNRTAKLQRKSSENSSSASASSSSSVSLVKKKKRPSPRNPLKDLNSTCVNPRLSGEAPRGGCFSFFASNSSSSRPQPRTPISAPPNSIAQTARNPKKFYNASSENSNKFQGSSGSSKTEWNRKRSGSKDTILGNGRSSKGKCPNSNLSFDVDLEKNGSLGSAREKGVTGFKHELSLNSQPSSKISILGTGYVPRSGDSNPNIRPEVDEMTSGCCLNSSPEKNFVGFSPELGLQSIETGTTLSNTPNSNTTPPIQASISPEIACGSNAEPTPACFAAGHVITGVHDRRKCRPRGILTVGEGCGFSDESRISSAVPPVAEASIHWLSSPSENFSCSSGWKADEASINWFVSPTGDLEEGKGKSEVVGPKVTPFRIRDSSDLGFWRFSPNDSNTSRSPKPGGILGLVSPDFETTPSSGNDVRRTPNSGSSISPFSAMVKRAKPAVSGFRFSRPHAMKGGYRYGSAAEDTPISGDSWSELNGTSTPSSYSKSRKKGVLSPFNLESMADAFGSMRLSPKTDAFDITPPLLDLSFKFGCPGTPLNSVDMTGFNKPLGAPEEVCSIDKDPCGSDLRISWRDGLVSRIFEMDEPDYCLCFSDNEENADCIVGEERVESKSELDYGLKNTSPMLNKENDKHLQYGSLSFEFPYGGIDARESEEKGVPPGSSLCAESFSTDGCLISSGDSDWTLFYKNDLFEG